MHHTHKQKESVGISSKQSGHEKGREEKMTRARGTPCLNNARGEKRRREEEKRNSIVQGNRVKR